MDPIGHVIRMTFEPLLYPRDRKLGMLWKQLFSCGVTMRVFPVAITLTLILGSSACRTRNFGNQPHSPSTAKNLSTTGASSEVESPFAHGGPFNFGIPFAKVTETKAKSFWQSYKDKESFTGSLAPTDVKSAFTEFPTLSDDLAGVLVEPSRQKVILSAVKAFVDQAHPWMKLKCLDVDVKASLDRKSLVVLGAATDHSAAAVPVCKFFVNRHTATESRAMSSVPTADDVGGALVSGGSLTFDVKRKVTNDLLWSRHELFPQTEFFSIGHPVSAEPILAAQFSVDLKTADGRILTGPGFSLIVAGNYLIPLNSYAASKIFAVPVMEFDPKTGARVAFFDLGLLYLMNLPKNGNFLASVINPGDVPHWKSSNLDKVGNFASKAPGKRGQYLPIKEVESFGFKPYWKTERLPVGAMHYVLNGRWHNMTKMTPFGIIPHSLTREELLSLYKGDSGEMGLAVNSLDFVNTHGIAQTPVKLDATTSPSDVCKAWKNHLTMTPTSASTFMESEVLLFPGRSDVLMRDATRLIHVDCP